MSDEKKFDYGILSSYGTGKFYHRPGWASYAAKANADRKKAEENAKVVLKEKRMNAGNTHYTFSIIQKKNTKPYLRISGYIEKTGYRGTIVVFAPYVPTFVGMVQQLAKGLE